MLEKILQLKTLVESIKDNEDSCLINPQFSEKINPQAANNLTFKLLKLS